MEKIIILTDSTCDLPSEIVKKENIIVLPLLVQFSDKTFRDGIDIDATTLFNEIEKRNELPKTGGLSATGFIEKYNELLKDNDDKLIYCGIGSSLSSTFQNAFIARNELDDEMANRIYLIDSMNLSSGIGLLILKMCDLIKDGKSASEIVDIIESLISNVRSQFSVKTLDYLYKGGGLTGAEKVIGSFLRVRPILRVIDGKIINTDKIMGHYDKALQFQIDDVINNIDDIDLTRLFITSCNSDENNKWIYDNLPKEIKEKFKEIIFASAGCVISTHCGQGSTGILYISKKRITQ